MPQFAKSCDYKIKITLHCSKQCDMNIFMWISSWWIRGSRICQLLGWGHQPQRWGHQTIIWANFPERYMRVKKIGLGGMCLPILVDLTYIYYRHGLFWLRKISYWRIRNRLFSSETSLVHNQFRNANSIVMMIRNGIRESNKHLSCTDLFLQTFEQWPC